MATIVISSSAPNRNYADGQNWVGGVPPTVGSTVVINLSPPNGPLIATSLPIAGQTITLSNNGTLYTAGNTTFNNDPMFPATLTDQNTGSGSVTLQAGDFLTNNATIVNANYIQVTNTTASATEIPVFTNNGVLSYTTNLGGTRVQDYFLNAYNGGNGGLAAIQFTNNGGINVTSPAGANEGPNNPPELVTQVYITAASNGSGTVNVAGSAPNSPIGPSATAPTESVLEFQRPVSGTMTFNLNDGELQFDATASGTVNFLDASSILDLASVPNTGYANLAINGFQAGDAIGLGTTQVTSAAYDTVTKLIDLFNGATNVGTLDLVGAGVPTATYSIVPATALPGDRLLPTFNSARSQVYLETNVVPCYCPGTMILTDRGEVAVEDLAIGDRVITLDGSAQPIKWLGRRSFGGRFIVGRADLLPVCIRAGALGAGLPRRDLHVSPLHAMHLDGVLVPAATLVNDVSITQATGVEQVDYIHVELDRHSVIWAEGAASETFVDDNSRGMFHNAAEFDQLYPGVEEAKAVYCAPRVEKGDRLAAIKQWIDALAKLEPRRRSRAARRA